MYGTVAQLKLKAGKEAALMQELGQYPGLKIPGFVSTTVYRLDADANAFMLVVAFKDKAAYKANADDPKQDERYQRLSAIFAAAPEWHDGEIIWSESA